MVFCFVGGKWLFGRASGECACLRAGLDYLLRVTVCNTFPFLSIMRSSGVFLLADTMEKPGSGLQNTVRFDGLHLAGERTGRIGDIVDVAACHAYVLEVVDVPADVHIHLVLAQDGIETCLHIRTFALVFGVSA